MGNITKIEKAELAAPRVGPAIAAVPHRIGDGFSARHFSEEMFGYLREDRPLPPGSRQLETLPSVTTLGQRL